MGSVTQNYIVRCVLASCSIQPCVQSYANETAPLLLEIKHLSLLSIDDPRPVVSSKSGLQLPVGTEHSLEIVTLPTTVGAIRADRPRHALRMPSQAIANTMRQFGFQVSQCETLTRVPSKLRQSEGSVHLDVALTFKVSCKY